MKLTKILFVDFQVFEDSTRRMHHLEARRCQEARTNLHLQEARHPMLCWLQAFPLRLVGEEDPLRLLEGGPHGRTLRQEGRAWRTNARVGKPLLRFRDQGSPTQVLRSRYQRTLNTIIRRSLINSSSIGCKFLLKYI